MCDDQNVLAALQLHDDRLEPNHNVAIRLSTQIAVIVLVFVALGKVLGILLLDLGVGQAVAYAGVELIERFPF